MGKSIKISTLEIEEAVARYFGVRQNIIVPGICFGMNLHECDLIVIRRSNYAMEVEIKITISDLKKDALKKHGHKSNRIKELYFAIPEYLYDKALPFIPEHAGILVAFYIDNTLVCTRRRDPITNKMSYPLSDEEVFQAARLGTMRIWNLKRLVISCLKKIKMHENAH